MTANQEHADVRDSIEHGTDTPSAKPSRWDDPSVPVGNAPAASRWPLIFLGVAWAGWVAFLVIMMITVRSARGG